MLQVVSAPFEAGLLVLPAPWCLVAHMAGCLVGEAWIGVCVAVLLEAVPADLTASATATYFLVLQLGGAAVPMLVPGLSRGLGLRGALLLCFPGLYLLAAAVFAATWAVMRRAEKRGQGGSQGEQATEAEGMMLETGNGGAGHSGGGDGTDNREMEEKKEEKKEHLLQCEA